MCTKMAHRYASLFIGIFISTKTISPSNAHLAKIVG